MRQRKLGKTNINVSEIGLGTWGMGGSDWWGNANDTLILQTIMKGIDSGINFIDTAYVYGDGHSEELIAQAFKNLGQRVTVATKVPPKNRHWPSQGHAEEVFTKDWIISCTERSLRNLRTDCIDVQQLHVWRDDWLDADGWKEAADKLRRDGKIRYFGVSVDDHKPDNAIKLVESGYTDTVQVIYNIFDQTPEDNLFPACQKHNVGVIVRVPFDEGGLTGTLTPDTDFGKDAFRKSYFSNGRLEETIGRVKTLQFLIRNEIKTMAQAALKFCLTHPAVSTVIPGMRKPERIEENVTVSDGIPLTQEECLKLKKHRWPESFA